MPTKDTSRLLGPWMCTALVVGNIIGSGVFLLPAALSPYGLANSTSAWLFTASGAVILACVLAGLSRGLPGAAGPHAYARTAFGELPAFLIIWGYWISVWAGNAAIATGSVSYLAELFPVISERPGAAPLVTVSAVWLLTDVNVLGARAAGGVQVVTTVMKLLPLFVIYVADRVQPITLSNTLASRKIGRGRPVLVRTSVAGGRPNRWKIVADTSAGEHGSPAGVMPCSSVAP